MNKARRKVPAIRLFAASLVLAFSAAVPALGQDSPPASAVATAPVEHVYVALTTSAGVIVLDLDKTHAPLTVANFLKYVDGKRFDGANFYRAMHLDWGDQPNGLLQGGL